MTKAYVAQPVFVLVQPQMGENIGAAARAMWNFGLHAMRLVAPRDGWPNPRAEAMASGAGHVLDAARLHGSTAEACADLGFVFATTARDRALTKRVLSPEHAMAEARAMAAAGERVGVLFGPERAGLETADVVRANAVISVPTNPASARSTSRSARSSSPTSGAVRPGPWPRTTASATAGWRAAPRSTAFSSI